MPAFKLEEPLDIKKSTLIKLKGEDAQIFRRVSHIIGGHPGRAATLLSDMLLILEDETPLWEFSEEPIEVRLTVDYTKYSERIGGGSLGKHLRRAIALVSD